MQIGLDNINVMNIVDFLGKKFDCECGRNHSIDVEKIVIEEGAIYKLPDILMEFNYKNIFMVSDNNTYKAAGELVEKTLLNSKLRLTKLTYKRDCDLVPDETAVGEFIISMDKDTDVIVAVGTGVINDLSKYVGGKLGVPYIIVASAPSMDGYASDTAALIVDNLKTSYSARPPKVIIGDVNILKEAPLQMILAGLGDVLGKYSSLCDWKLSNIINDEYYCDIVVKMVRSSMNKCIEYIDGYPKRDDIAVKNLMEALVLTGIAMSFVGNSRPASGSEHHISHLQEMTFLFEGKQAVLHGAKVGVSTLATLKMMELLSSLNLKFDELKIKASAFDEDNWKKNIIKIYQQAAPGVLELSEANNRNSIEKRLQRFEKIQANWNLIVETLKEVPPAEKIKEMLQRVGAPISPKQIGVSEELVINSLMYAKEVRERYTILQLLWDIGLLEQFSAMTKYYYFHEEKQTESYGA